MMVQFLDIKAGYGDALLFYRMGDFYELFFDDAVAAAHALDIALTHRGQHLGQRVPMCGVPFHAAEGYLERLIKQGFRVAICEQTEDPVEARKRGTKAVVRREVVRLVTPGTISEEALLDARASNYLAALGLAGSGQDGDEMALAWLDMSTGEFFVNFTSRPVLPGLLARVAPREIVLPPSADTPMSDEAPGASGEALATHIIQIIQAMQAAPTVSGVANLSSSQARALLVAQFGPRADDLGADLSRSEIIACGLVLAYLRDTQLAQKPLLALPMREQSSAFMGLDAATRSNLELTRTLSGERKGSLLATLDLTVSTAGGRLLGQYLAAPLAELAPVQARLDGVAHFVADHTLRENLRNHLKVMPDMARALSRLAMGRGSPRDLQTLEYGLSVARGVHASLLAGDRLPPHLHALVEQLADQAGPVDALAQCLRIALVDQPGRLARDGGFVRDGYHAGLDEARGLRDESRRIIAALQQQYVALTDVKSLKIKHNGVLGYHIDVSTQHGDKLMRAPFDQTFIHRQTLANSVRFSTTELAELAGRISRAGEAALAYELQIFDDLVAEALALHDPIGACAAALAALDVSTALAALAVQRQWVAPRLDDGLGFEVEGGRHPVVEAALLTGHKGVFIANDCQLDAQAVTAPRLLLLTGPNMAGKSTFLRQNALIAIIAQMGSFVPATAARIGLVDRVFSRVGAADDLARGRSTFMVEMVETATILNQAGPRALVILDEIGRGTATFDGLSIAWAAVEYLHDGAGCRTLFATHYHELTGLAERLDGLANASMRVREHDGQLVFLHEVIDQAADRSYGIHVAELAGLPPSVIARARDVLALLEESRAAGGLAPTFDGLPLFTSQNLDKSNKSGKSHRPPADALRDALAGIEPDRLSPREALDWLYRLKTLHGALDGILNGGPDEL